MSFTVLSIQSHVVVVLVPVGNDVQAVSPQQAAARAAVTVAGERV